MIGDRRYFREALAGRFFSSDVVTSRDSGRKVLVAAVPVKSEGRIVGVIATAVKHSAFSALFIDHFELGEKGFALLVDHDGGVIASSRAPDLLGYSSIARIRSVSIS
jgi:methyl-accepting chemotaxis protein